MRKTACLTGIFAVGAGILAGGVPAFAASADNDGINLGNDNNLSVLPIQLCGNNFAVVGAVVPIMSSQLSDCANASIVDHPVVNTPTKPSKPTKPCDHVQPGDHGYPGYHVHPGGHGYPGYHVNPCDPGHDAVSANKPVSRNENLPTAPTPVAVRGHHAVTG